MWLCTTRGFFSAVEHRDDAALLLVRARVRDDLVQLRAALPREQWTRIVATPHADYPYRMVVARDLFAVTIARLVVEELTYDNFKAAVTDPHHERVYHEAWAVFRGLERLPPRLFGDAMEPRGSID